MSLAERQNNGATVEGELQKALDQLFGPGVELTGASRTDAGVHALGNVAVFDVETRIPPEKIAVALNHKLTENIRILESEEVAPDFHPRYAKSDKNIRIHGDPHGYRDSDTGPVRLSCVPSVECGGHAGSGGRSWREPMIFPLFVRREPRGADQGAHGV